MRYSALYLYPPWASARLRVWLAIIIFVLMLAQVTRHQFNGFACANQPVRVTVESDSKIYGERGGNATRFMPALSISASKSTSSKDGKRLLKHLPSAPKVKGGLRIRKTLLSPD